MAENFRIARNPNLKPTFREGLLVILTKDCTDHTDLNYESGYDPEIEYFKKGCAFSIIECGVSKYPVSKTGELLNPISNEEWCIVEVVDENLDEDYYIDGIVRADDLREGGANDL